MNWELIGWLAMGASALVILAAFLAQRGAARTANATEATPPAPLQGWLEIAWPVFFVSAMGMLALKEVVSFPAVLLLASVLTGAIWGADRLLLKSKRGAAPEPALVEMSRSFFPVIVIIFLLRSFLYEPFKIPSESMLPTLHVGDFILVNKFTYGVRLPVANIKLSEGGPQRGDIMVFRLPENPSKDLVKRVIGLPGDTVSYLNKRLTINGMPIEQHQIDAVTEVDAQLGLRRADAFAEKMGERMHTILLNPVAPGVNPAGVRPFPNRDRCRYLAEGFVCMVPPGHYFMMGDNRDNSADSRYWGFVPDKNIVGKAFFVWLNLGNWRRIGSIH
jgi:signal peptidase I